MSTVLVTGASGYIGQSVAVAFRTAGYRVYGLVRSAEKAAALVRHEVIPVVGDLKDASSFSDVLAAASVVVDTVPPDWSNLEDTHAPSRNLLRAVEKAAVTHKVTKTFIYTSGVLVYTPSERVRDESTPINEDELAPLFRQRLAFEREVVGSTEARGIVIRPGFVFGGSVGAGNHLVNLFENGKKDKIVIHNLLKPVRWNWVHVSDLAESYVRAAKQSHAVRGEVFNVVGNSTPTYEEILLATAKVAGFSGTVEYTDEKSNDWLTTLASKTVVLSNQKAFDLLGWRPNHLGVLDELDILYHTVKGSW